jgi:hypothetical protein
MRHEISGLGEARAISDIFLAIFKTVDEHNFVKN